MYKIGLIKFNKKTGKYTEESLKILKRAIEKIRLSAFYVYENQKIEAEIKKIREEFCISGIPFKEAKFPLKSKNLKALLANNILAWHDKKLGETKNKKLIELDRQIFKENNFDEYNPGHVNPVLWRQIIGAKIFNISQKRLFDF